MDFHAKEIGDLHKELKSSDKGLTSQQAKQRLAKYGKNIIQKKNTLKPLKILIEQFKSFLIYILLIATVISFLIGHLTDAIVILAIVFINAGIGFFQQYKAEKAIISLRKLLVETSKVIRDGKHIEISSSEVVPGDILLLEPGNKIGADSRIIELENLQTIESVLTGESLPISKSLGKLSKNTSLAKQDNMLFAGTQIVRGTAKALVVSTGMNTVFGKIATSLQELEEQKTPMQKRLDVFSKQIGIIILLLVGVITLLGFTKYFDLLKMFIVSVALAVSAIPEGLPAVLAIAFAIASKVMSKKNVIIRKLPAVESLGSVTVICTDKTGTLTEEKMHVQKIFSNNEFYTKKSKELFLETKKVNPLENKDLALLIKTSVLCNNARFELTNKKGEHKFLGDPTEIALVEASLDLGFNKKTLIEKEHSIEKFEFNSKRKMMSVVRACSDKTIGSTMYSKGSPERILEISSFELANGKIKKLTEKRKKDLREHSKKLEEEAYRVLAFAYKDIGKGVKSSKEDNLVFLGFMGMIDPPRPEVKNALKMCKDAGIDVKIITGDSALTAKAIAKQIGLEGKIITEQELKKMSDAVLLRDISNIAIFARTTPHQKLRITKILQQKGEVVAMTGDGINDVLALKAADVGISMGIRGTDVARDVSDIVLVDDNFASIVEGVKQGRKTYDNIKKFTKYFLAVNFSEIFLILFALLAGVFFGAEKWFLPLLPLQILWINLITDSLPALSLVFEKPDDVMKSKPRKEKSILDNIWKFIIIAGIFALLAELIVYILGVETGISMEKTQTLVLTTVILFELFFVYTIRSEQPLLKIGIFSNKWLNYAVLISFALHIILLYTSLGNLFGVVPLSFSDWLLILPFGLSGLIVFELAKYFKIFKKR